MKKKNIFLLLVNMVSVRFCHRHKHRQLMNIIPNGQLALTIENGRVLQYSLSLEGKPVIHPSAICMTMENGNIWGKNGEVVGTSNKEILPEKGFIR